MKHLFRYRFFGLIPVLVISLPLLSSEINAAGTMETWLEPPSGCIKESDVNYIKDGDNVANWGVRGEHATFLTGCAEDYYTGNYTYENITANKGDANIEAVPSSALYGVLAGMMNDKAISETTYEETQELYKYTDCMLGDFSHISSFYSGVKLNGAWDSAKTWNREHVWPNSKIDNNGENDIMMLRPTWVNENSDRGNQAYGESSGYYDPDSESEGRYHLRGDCARVILYTYVRWGVTDTMWGQDGVIEDPDILLRWIEEDPVDTWEMGRNDAVQSITGVRNVFVDYPELSWLLFDRQVPENYISPSSISPESGHIYSAVITEPTCTKKGCTTYTCPVCGSVVIGGETEALGHVDEDHNGRCDICELDMPDESENFKPHTGELEEGDYMIIADGKALKAADTGKNRLEFAEVSEGGSIRADDEAIVFHLAPSGGYWTIFNEKTGLYVGGTGIKNQAAMMEGGTDNTLWTVYVEEGKFELANKKNEDAGVNCYLRSNGNYGFACYSKSTGSPLTLYRKSERQPADINSNGYLDAYDAAYLMLHLESDPDSYPLPLEDENYDMNEDGVFNTDDPIWIWFNRAFSDDTSLGCVSVASYDGEGRLINIVVIDRNDIAVSQADGSLSFLKEAEDIRMFYSDSELMPLAVPNVFHQASLPE